MFLNEFFKLAPKIEVKKLTFNSKEVEQGSVFFAIPGNKYNGHHFIDEAIANGASCIVHQEELAERQSGVVYVKCKDVVSLMAKFSSFFYQEPSSKLRLIAITGTNGKTTTAQLIQQFHQLLTTPCGYIGTLGFISSQGRETTGLTTPDALTINRLLHQLVQEEIADCVVEVSSHALKLQRVASFHFQQRLFTNFSQDHLDFHGDMEDYFRTKMQLFQGMKAGDVAIINLDDDRSTEVVKQISKESRIFTLGTNAQADFVISNLHLSLTGTSFDFSFKKRKYTVKSPLLGEHNVYNLMMAIVSLYADGIPLKKIINVGSRLKDVEGRMLRVSNELGLNIILDFAHTPKALEKMYLFSQQLSLKGQIISVFGSAGGRDQSKRPLLGEISDQYCGKIILTADDPRTESVTEICHQIKQGIQKCDTVIVEDRAQAIEMALRQATVDDIVLITGKGVEEFMYTGEGKEGYLGDHQVVQQVISQIIRERREND